RIRRYRGATLDAEQVFREIAPLVERLGPFITDTTNFINNAVREGRSVLVEGAQATLLDVDHGTYPFVTSSSTTSGGACVGLGLAPKKISGVLGIVRTYTTRVGEGPFPTEMLEGEAEIGQLIRERGHEYGVSTGRPRLRPLHLRADRRERRPRLHGARAQPDNTGSRLRPRTLARTLKPRARPDRATTRTPLHPTDARLLALD